MHRSLRIIASAALVVVAACGDDPTGPDPESLLLSADTVHLAAIGAADRLTATASDEDGVALGTVSVSWSSADEAVATVDGSGRVEAVGAGETEVTASAGDATDRATVIVTQSAASLSVSPAVRELRALGDSVRFSATVRDANGNAIPDAAVEWASGDEAVATVDASGWITAVANGTSTLTASAGGVSDDAAVVVEQAVASVDLSPAADTLGQGRMAQLEATIADSNGVAVSGKAVTWTSSDPGVATVDASGRVTGTGWGDAAAITATVDGVSGAADVRLLDQIAFGRDPGGDAQVFVMNADGSDLTNLSKNLEYEFGPAWSPDGSQVAFTRDVGSNDEVFVMDADGSNPLRLTDDTETDRDPAWSPDGSAIVFQSNRDGYYEIYVMNADGSAQTNLTENGTDDRFPDWSPDGSKIAFTSFRDSVGGDANMEIYVMNADGSGQTNVSDNASADHDPAWSPDGSQIAFVSQRDGDNDIYVMDADGSNPVNLTESSEEDRYPAWSPDGSRIAFVSQRDSNYEIYVMDADGSNQTRLTDDPAIDIRPSWRPRP